MEKIYYVIERTDTNDFGSLGVWQSNLTPPQQVNWYNQIELADKYETKEDAEFNMLKYHIFGMNIELIITEHIDID